MRTAEIIAFGSHKYAAAQPGIAADRFAPEILGILTEIASARGS
jgi:hypothetical protein